MARIRYIKPEFFFDEDLAGLPYQHRLAFAGLWCHADREGRMEDKPKTLKAKIFPYDAVNMEAILQALAEKPFIIRYSVNGCKYIQIVNFPEHQRPHHTEKASTIPKHDGEITVKSPLPDGEKKEGMGKGMGMEKGMGMGMGGESANVDRTPLFDELWSKYPNKDGKKDALRFFKASVKTDQDESDIRKALENYTKSDNVLRGYIKKGATWFNNWRDWIVPPMQDRPRLTSAQVANLKQLNNLKEKLNAQKRGVPTGIHGPNSSVPRPAIQCAPDVASTPRPGQQIIPDSH